MIVNSHSNYPDLYQIPNETSEAMQHNFSWFGVFSDNEPCFASAEYILFGVARDFKRTTSSLLYPHW